MAINSHASTLPGMDRLQGEVAVLCGGPGGEREVSLASGDNVHNALWRAGIPNRLVQVPVEHPEKVLEELRCGLAVMMFHGRFGEDGTAQEILERRGIPFTGSGSVSCRLTFDKTATKQRMRSLGMPVPRGVLVGSAAADEAEALMREAALAYPVFVKPNAYGSSVGASRADNAVGLAAALRAALACDAQALIEELIVGREMTVGWLGGELLPIIEMKAATGFYDYQAKYLSDATRYEVPAKLPSSVMLTVQKQTLAILDAVGARDLARVDFLYREDGPFFLEVNALPGFTGHSLVPMAAKAAGLSGEQVCRRLVMLALERAG